MIWFAMLPLEIAFTLMALLLAPVFRGSSNLRE